MTKPRKLSHLEKSQLAAIRRNLDDAKTVAAIAVAGHVDRGVPLAVALDHVGWSRSTYYRHLPKQLKLH